MEDLRIVFEENMYIRCTNQGDVANTNLEMPIPIYFLWNPNLGVH